MRRIVKQETVGINERLLQGFERMAAENAVLHHRLKQAEEKIEIQKRRAPRGKPLFEQLRAEGEQKAVFVSPSKVTRAFEIQAEREAIEQAKIARKEEAAVQRALNKARKEQELKERKIERERKREERLKAEAVKKAAREEVKITRAAEKQVLLEAKQSKKRSSNKNKQSSQSQAVVSFSQAVAEVPVVKSVKTRSGRKTKVPQYLQGYSE